MFYNFGTPPGDAVQVGPLKVSLTQIKIGIQSSIIAIPVNVLVVTIFRQLKAKDAGKPEGEGVKSQGCLPHWFVFVGWFICTMATLASAAFVVFYSLMWGAETSNEWLVSVMVSFFQDAIVMQPMKVLLVASILSILVKKPPEQEKVMGDAVQRNAAGEVITPDQAELDRARKFRSSLVQVGRKVVEFVLFGIFITLMMVVCYGNRGVERFMVTQSMDDLFQTFRKVRLTRLTTCAPKTIFSSLFPKANTWHLVISPYTSWNLSLEQTSSWNKIKSNPGFFFKSQLKTYLFKLTFCMP